MVAETNTRCSMFEPYRLKSLLITTARRSALSQFTPTRDAESDRANQAGSRRNVCPPGPLEVCRSRLWFGAERNTPRFASPQRQSPSSPSAAPANATHRSARRSLRARDREPACVAAKVRARRPRPPSTRSIRSSGRGRNPSPSTELCSPFSSWSRTSFRGEFAKRTS